MYRLPAKEVICVTAMDPLSKEELRVLAEKARTGELSSNERYDLDKAIRQDGRFGKELKRIRGDKD